MIIPQYTICELVRECLSTILEKSDKELYSQEEHKKEEVVSKYLLLEDGSGPILYENGTEIY